MAQALFATGWPQSSEEFGKENGTYVMHADTERGHPDRAARSSSGVAKPLLCHVAVNAGQARSAASTASEAAPDMLVSTRHDE